MNSRIRLVLLAICVGLLTGLVLWSEGTLATLILLSAFGANIFLVFQNQELKDDRQEIYRTRARLEEAIEQMSRLEADLYQIKRGKK